MVGCTVSHASKCTSEIVCKTGAMSYAIRETVKPKLYVFMHVNKNGPNKIRQICLSNSLLLSEFSDKTSISCRPVSFRIPIIFSTQFKSKHANIQPSQRRNIHFGLGTLSGRLTLKSLGKCTLEAMFFSGRGKLKMRGILVFI